MRAHKTGDKNSNQDIHDQLSSDYDSGSGPGLQVAKGKNRLSVKAGLLATALARGVVTPALSLSSLAIFASAAAAQTVTVTNTELSSGADGGNNVPGGAATNSTEVIYNNVGGSTLEMTISQTGAANIGIYQLGGAGTVAGLWVGADDPDGFAPNPRWTTPESESYEVSFDADVTSLDLVFSAINYNEDGFETVVIDAILDGAGNDVTASTTITHMDMSGFGSGSTTYNAATRTMLGVAPNTCCNSSGQLTFARAAGIRTVRFRRVEPGNTIMTKPLSLERANGMGFGPISFVAVPPLVVVATNDSASGINGATGATGVVNAFTADTIAGVAASTANATLTLKTGSTVPAGLTFDPATGNVDVVPGTPAGSYSFEYTICATADPSICQDATITVDVVASPISAVNDNVGGISSVTGGTAVLNVLTGDLVNGIAASTTNADLSVAAGSTVPAGLTFDPATGNIDVAPGTPAGPYSFDYQICEKLNPTNCEVATATVTVVATSIAATDDMIGGIIGAVGGDDVLNLFDGDTLGGIMATPANTTLGVATGFTVPPELTFDPATGNVDVLPGTPAGTYSFDYEICETADPANCAIATATVTVIPAPVVATNDSATGINGVTGATAVVNAFTADTINGVAATPTNAIISVATGSTVPPELVFDPAMGSVDVAPGTPAGTYMFNYTLCERLNPANCMDATIEVSVVASPISAVSDSVSGVSSVTGGDDVLNVLTGDTVNGAPATTTNAVLSVAPGSTVPAGLTFDPATGNIDVAPATPAGTYSFDYQICEALNPGNCQTATATVGVTVPVLPPNFTTNITQGQACMAAGGSLGTTNFFTDLDGGSFGTGSGAADEVPTTNPYAAQIAGGIYSNDIYGAFGYGNYSIISNHQMPRNMFQHGNGIYDPVNGVNGRFFLADPDVSTPTFSSELTGLTDGESYEISFWAADSEIRADNLKNRIGITVDGTEEYNTGFVASGSPMEWTKYSFIYIHDSVNPTANIEINSLETGQSGRDFFLDEIKIFDCTLPADLVTVKTLASTDSTPAEGETVTFDITVTNNGDGVASNVTLTDFLPGGLTATPGNGAVTVGSYSDATGIWNIGTLTNGSSATLTLEGIVDVGQGGMTITNVTTAAMGDEPDPTTTGDDLDEEVVVDLDIAASPDTPAPVVGATGGDDIINAFDNDELDGAPVVPADITTTITTPATPLTPGAPVPVMDPVTGLVDVPAGTPSGTYTINYQICETANPTNCADSVVAVEVTDAPIVAVDDSATGINGVTGAMAVVNAFTADTINGVAASPANATITLAPGETVPAGLTFDPATGNVDVVPGTPAGSYTFDYQICETLNPANCEIATITVDVIAVPIAASPDTPGPVPGAAGGDDIINAFDNDELDGNPVDPADIDATITTPATPLTPGAPVPVMDPATGLVDVPPGTPAGTYTISYQICETLNPANCADSFVTVEVTASPIVAIDDSATGINGATGATMVVNAFTADTINGVAASPANVTITLAPGEMVPTGLTFDPATGNVDVVPGTPAGSYMFDYQICETLNPANCEIATITVDVIASPIAAVDDSVGGISSAAGGNDVLNVLTGDTVNGAPATAANVDISVAPGSTVPAGLSFDPATGNIDVAPGTPGGTYSFDYQICEKLNPTNCEIATATVTVAATPITATDDTVGGIVGAVGGDDVLNLFDGDTVDGDPATSANATLKVAPGFTVPPELVFDPATGNVDVVPGTPAGTYSFDYEICEAAIPDNCEIATATVTVIEGPITAIPDTPPPVSGITGDPGVTNAYDNDTLNGDPVDPDDINGTILTPATPLNPGDPVPVMDPVTGNVAVPPGTPAGTYTIEYEICEKLNPTNCETSTVTVVVEETPIAAIPDAPPPVPGITGDPSVVNAYDNDTLNGDPVDPDDINGTILTPATPLTPGAPVPVMDPVTGNVAVPPGTPAGTYTIAYEICEKLNPANCVTTNVTVVVEETPIDATPDAPPPVNGTTGDPDVGNAYDNDTLNGDPVDPDDINGTILTSATPLNPGDPVPVLDPVTGIISVPPGTPAGNYTIEYEICEKLNPANCETSTVTVEVIAPPIEAAPDMPPPVDGGEGDPNVGNAYDNDTLNGDPVDPEDIIGTILTPAAPLNPGDPVPVMDPITGIISVPPGTPGGSYDIVYQICEKLNPVNCKTATVTVEVEDPVGGISGIVFVDANDDDIYEDGERLLEDWIVEIRDADGNVVATTRTDASGFYQVDGLPLGDYSVGFRNPESGVLYGTISDITLAGGTVIVDQNLPIDPSGVVYDAVTRQPVPGVRLTLVDGNGSPLPEACFVDAAQQNQLSDATGFYRFDIVPGAAAACPVGETEYQIRFDAPGTYSDQPSTVIAPQADPLNPTMGIGSFAVVDFDNAPTMGEDTTYYLSFLLASGDRDIVNNHIALDPFQMRTPLILTKTSIKRSVSTGELVPYTITVRNAENIQRSNVDVVDIIPPGFKYIPGSAFVNQVASEPAQTGRELRWTGQVIPANGTSTYNMTMVVGAGVTGGDRINTGVARNGFDASEISNRGQAVVSIVPSAIFDCAEIIGKVFDDRDGDGYQDKGEPGIASVRLANVNGQLITTDEYGRYHITCAAVPNARIGSNYVLKLDTRTLPSGYAVTSENPRAVRLTRGKITKLNFGAKLAQRVVITLDARAFGDDSIDLKSSSQLKFDDLRDQVDPKNPLIRIIYTAGDGEDMALAKARVTGLTQVISRIFETDWEGSPPTIETNVVRTTSNSGGE